MKRSEINQSILNVIHFTDQLNFKLPPFAYWKNEEWDRKSDEYNEIRDIKLGWDVTDFGYGDFSKYGFVAFTLRNGSLYSEKYEKTYAEKIIVSLENQITPFHYHWSKMEDIINRGGGNLLIQLYNSTEDDKFSDSPVMASVDGRNFEIPAGGMIRLTPGESVSLHRRVYHKFWAEEGHGPVLLGEVSMLNDDDIDNRFYDSKPRFTQIEEDIPALYRLCNEY